MVDLQCDVARGGRGWPGTAHIAAAAPLRRSRLKLVAIAFTLCLLEAVSGEIGTNHTTSRIPHHHTFGPVNFRARAEWY